MQAFDGDGANSLGLLRTYLYGTPEEEPNIVGGPRLMVQRFMQTGEPVLASSRSPNDGEPRAVQDGDRRRHHHRGEPVSSRYH